MSDRCSAASAASTSDSNEPECTSLGSAKPTSGDAASSPNASRASLATRTFEKSHRGSSSETDPDRWQESELAPTLNGMDLRYPSNPPLLISSAADSRAKTSASPADEQASPAESDPASSLSSPESLTLFSRPEDGWSLRMFPDFFPATPGAISPSFSRRWPTSGFTTSPGECWTADTSECPSGAGASSSLRDVLEDDVPPRYFLSPRAAAGILRRAEKRGRELPTHLSAALEAVSRTTTTDKPAAS